MKYKIAPSLLAADMTRLGEEVEAVIAAGADLIHLDVMDNHYVPNLTMGPFICEALTKRFPQLRVDVHLMASPVDELIKAFSKAGASQISIHPEATLHLDRSLQLIKEQGVKAGIALNPATSIDYLNWCAHQLEFVLIMTVNPGFGGQKLIPQVLQKIKAVHAAFPHLEIAVDGGVTLENIHSLAKAGASFFIAGSSVFSTKNYQQTIASMRKALQTE